MSRVLDKIRYSSEARLPEARYNGDFPYLVFPSFEGLPGIRHLVTTKLGGVSEGIWESLNLITDDSDPIENVQENYRRVADALGVDPHSFVLTQQTHTTNILKVTREDAGKGLYTDYENFDIDGLVTDVPGITLCGFYADCVPIIFADPVERVVGVAHSGWKGTVGRISQRMIEIMTADYGCSHGDIYAAVGPAIGQECYEVSEDVILKVNEAFKEEQYPSLYYRKDNGRYQLNLKKAVELTLLESGVDKEKLWVSDICTKCNKDIFFSCRGVGGKRGDFGAFISLDPQDA